MTQENRRPQDRLKLYRLVPVAKAGDPTWDGAENQSEIIVRAFSAPDARVAAGEADSDVTQIDASPTDANASRDASAFCNERLYAVVEMLDHLGIAAAGPRGVVEGIVLVGTANPTQIS